MKSKNYPKQILELLDSKSNHSLDAREIAKKVIIKEDKEENLKYVRSCLTRLRKRQKIYVRSVNKDKERCYCTITWLIEFFEEIAFEDPKKQEIDLAELNGMERMIKLMGYVKKEALTSEDLIYEEPVEINESNFKQITKEKYGIGV